MNTLNWTLITAFMQRRFINGIPSKQEIVERIKKTSTRTVTPAGWTWN